MISVKNLTYEYPGTRALDNVSFEIPERSITAIVGPNGAGKTTLLKCLAALTKPFAGEISVNGIDVLTNPRDAHRIIGFLPDFFGLYDNLTVKRSLEYSCLAHDVEESLIEERIEKTLVRIGLTDKRDEKVESLSRGMRQRLAIGQTIIHEPKVLILDEPASGLDPEARTSLSKLFLELNAEGITLLVSSHIIAELDEYANNLLTLRQGHLAGNKQSAETFVLKKRLVMRLVDQPAGVEEILAKFIGEVNIEKKDGVVMLDFEGDEHQQHELLKKILDSGLKVSEFYHKKDSLREKYMDSLK